MATFKDLRTLVDQMDVHRGTLGGKLDAVLDSARCNADDTVYVDKSRPVEDWDAVALATVSDVLSCTTDEEVIAWFVGHGIQF